MTVAFHAWNPFQVFQIADIARAHKDSVLLLERRAKIDFTRVFDQSVLGELGIPVIETTARKIADADGQFSAIVCQTPFRFIERLQKTKRIAMQYSMTKEGHQYGAWRTLFDLNLMYGEYSQARVTPLAPCRVVGNPRFEAWFSGSLNRQRLANAKAHLDPAKKTILYLPTWGDLSSVPLYQSAIGKLSDTYNVIAKVHHNTDALELKRKVALGSSGLNSIFGASDDLLYLLDCADMVLSDYSGAIFDALNVRKPVVLLQNEPEKLNGQKFGLESIEYARRDEIGPVADDPERLAAVLEDAFENPSRFQERNSILKDECFGLETGCGEASAEAISDLVNGRIAPRAYYQIYLREELLNGRNLVEKLKGNPLQGTKPKGNRLRPAAFFRGASRTFNAVSFRFGMLVQGLVGAALGTPDHGLSRMIGGILTMVPTASLVPVARAFLRHGYQDAAVETAELAALRGNGRPLNSLVTIAGRRNNVVLLEKMFGLFGKLPDRVMALNADQAARVSEALGSSDSARDYLRRSRQLLIADARDSRTKPKFRALCLAALLKQRCWSDAENIALKAGGGAIKSRIGAQLDVARVRMQDWFGLIELANLNARGDDQWCMWQHAATRLEDLGDVPIVEFFIPTCFGDIAPTLGTASEQRICAFLRSLLSELVEGGIAIAPRHQFWLDIANPTGHWPAISYHTTGRKPGWLHLKDSPLPGYYRFDTKGYAGFSSLAELTEMPPMALAASASDVDTVWNEVLEARIGSISPEDPQKTSAIELPEGEFIFFPLQLPDRRVSDLAWIPMLDAVKAVIQAIALTKMTLVIKRHPLCKSPTVKRALNLLGRLSNVFITDGSIHDILPRAKAVVTVNSDIGFDALLYGKYVITVGRSDYGVASRQCRTKAELFNAIVGMREPDIDTIKRFVWLYTKNCVRPRDLSPISDWARENQPAGSSASRNQSARLQ